MERVRQMQNSIGRTRVLKPALDWERAGWALVGGGGGQCGQTKRTRWESQVGSGQQGGPVLQALAVSSRRHSGSSFERRGPIGALE